MVFKLVKDNTSINFLGPRRRAVAVAISALAVVVSLAFIIFRGLDFGVDFTGGVLLEVGYPEEADVNRIREEDWPLPNPPLHLTAHASYAGAGRR